VGLTIKLKEDPQFIPQEPSAIQKAALLEQYFKERVYVEDFQKGHNSYLIQNHIEETINLSAYIREIRLTDLDITNKRKLTQMLIQLNILDFKYTNAGMDQFGAMVNDVNKLFVNPGLANAWDYVDLHNFEGSILFQDELMKLYFATKGNPIVLEALTVYRQNTIIYNQLLHNLPLTSEQEIASYNDIRSLLRASYNENK
jgi:hypothetical protein